MFAKWIIHKKKNYLVFQKKINHEENEQVIDR